jgi:hypothetical protein
VLILGVVLLIIGFILKIAILWTLGIILLIIGAVLFLLGSTGRAVGGRRHYWWTRPVHRSWLMRVLAALIVVWLLVGAVAAAQRNYFKGGSANCAKLGTIAVTLVAGPLNYVGVNPKIRCRVPQPSK